MGGLPLGDVTGTREAMAVLRKVEKDVARQGMQDIKKAAEPLRSGIASRAPARVLSGVRGGRGVRVTTNYGGRKNRDGESTLVKVRLVGPKWTAAAEFAARDRRPGGTFARNVAAKYGGAPRFAWPVADAMLGRIQAAVGDACKAVQRQANAALGSRGA